MQQTPLHFAVESGMVAEIRLLCAYGASTTAETEEGLTVSDIVAKKKEAKPEECARLLGAVVEGSCTHCMVHIW